MRYISDNLLKYILFLFLLSACASKTSQFDEDDALMGFVVENTGYQKEPVYQGEILAHNLIDDKNKKSQKSKSQAIEQKNKELTLDMIIAQHMESAETEPVAEKSSIFGFFKSKKSKDTENNLASVANNNQISAATDTAPKEKTSIFGFFKKLKKSENTESTNVDVVSNTLDEQVNLATTNSFASTTTNNIEGNTENRRVTLAKASKVNNAYSLQRILQKVLTDDPTLYEAWANEQAAQSRVDGSFALHYPTVNVGGNQLLSQSSDDPAYEKSKKFEPTVAASLNLFSWGAINNQVKRDKEKERYHYYKYYETREELGQTIATEYLNALYYREALEVLRDSLSRHGKIMHDLNVIVKNDPGRRSEWVQGRAREVQVKQSIATYESNLKTALSRLEKYTGRRIDADKLSDPFPITDANQIKEYMRQDNMMHPTYMAQKAELQSVRAELKSSKGRLLPEVNLQAAANRDTRQVYVNLSWDLLNRSTSHEVSAHAHELAAAEARLDQVSRDINERTRTALLSMEQSRERVQISEEQIRSNRDVVHAYDLQFKIARRTLIELLNAYNDLASVELSAANARNDFRMASLSYLHAQHGIATWADVPENTERDKRYIEETQPRVKWSNPRTL